MKPLKDFDGYYATEDGEIFSSFKGGVLKSRVQNSGYLEVVLRSKGKYYTRTVHRLVAIANLGDSQLQVNHKDGNKLNNKPSNLEFVTAQQNQRHARDVLRAGLKPVQVTKHGVGFWYPSQGDCMKDTGMSQQQVSSLATGARKVANGYHTTMFMEQ